MIATLRARVARRNGPFDETPRVTHHEGGLPEFVACANRLCKGGGASLWPLLEAMVKARETTKKTGCACGGHEQMNRRQTRECLWVFEADFDVTYQAES